MYSTNPKKSHSARRKRGVNVVTGYFKNLKWQVDQIRAHYLALNQQEVEMGTHVVHDHRPAVLACIRRYEKFYGLNNKYHANGQLKAA